MNRDVPEISAFGARFAEREDINGNIGEAAQGKR
jgi:hypothetical protein